MVVHHLIFPVHCHLYSIAATVKNNLLSLKQRPSQKKTPKTSFSYNRGAIIRVFNSLKKLVYKY